jgi:hypothetical protein
MTALTPGCDPDMSTTGAPFGPSSGDSGLRSGLVLLVVVTVAALVATGDAVPGAAAVPATVVGLLCALVLVRRGIRLTYRAGALVAASASRTLHRSTVLPTRAP